MRAGRGDLGPCPGPPGREAATKSPDADRFLISTPHENSYEVVNFRAGRVNKVDDATFLIALACGQRASGLPVWSRLGRHGRTQTQ
jgi:hypothetical protein